jgi:hypothetical protein
MANKVTKYETLDKKLFDSREVAEKHERRLAVMQILINDDVFLDVDVEAERIVDCLFRNFEIQFKPQAGVRAANQLVERHGI